jgi:hypothetical protein
MATIYSDQLTLGMNQTTNFGSGINTTGVRKRASFFSKTVNAVTAATRLDCFVLPPGARLLSGKINTSALGTSVTVAMGTDTALTLADGTTAAAGAANLLAQTAAATAVQLSPGVTLALGAGALTTGNGETTFYITTAGATTAATDQVITGWFEYAQN